MLCTNNTSAFRTTHTIQPKQSARRLAFVYEGVAYGGTEEYILLMLRYLDPSRYQPIVVISGFNYRFCPPEFLAKVQALGVPIVHSADTGHSRLQSFTNDTLNLIRTFRQLDVDVVHIHNQRPDGGRRATVAARLAGVRAVLRSEHLPPSSNINFHTPYSIKLFDALTDYIIAGSDSCLQEHLSLLGRDATKTLRIFYGIELDRFSPDHDVAAAKARLGLDPTIPTVGKIARLAPEKGHIYLIEAAAKVIRAFGPVNFLLAGNGPLEAQLRARVAQLGIADHVHFLGFAQDTVPFIEAMDITTMASVSEGISLAMLEYMAMGKPVVSTREPSFEETVIGEESGILVALKNPDALAEGILKLLRDPALAEKIGAGAYKRVRAEFDICRNVAHFMDLYDTIFARSSARSRPIARNEAEGAHRPTKLQS
jgi:glycosyltransferase involved in cell wall biosynthesis